MSSRTYTLRGLFVTAAIGLIFLPLIALGGGLVGWAVRHMGALQAEGDGVRLVEQQVERLLAARWEQLQTDPTAVGPSLRAMGEGDTLVLEVRDLQGKVLYASAGVEEGWLLQRGFRLEPTQRVSLVRQGDQTLGVAHLWIWPPQAARWVSQALSIGFWAATLTLAAILLGVLRGIGRQILQPLRELQAATAAIAAGDLEVAVPHSAVRELSALARSFGAMREQLSRSLERQQRLEQERRQFIAAIGHDLRTPLSSVRAFAEGLRDGLAREPEKATRYGQVILAKTHELEALVEGLFEYARLDLPGTAAELQQVAAREYLTAAVAAFQPAAAPRSISLTAVGPDMDLLVDPDLFMRALNNLLANALRHTPAGGAVSVRWEPDPATGGAIIAVADTGEGIPPEELPHLFSPLHRTDRSRSRRSGGAGLGLAITARIVAAHGGQIGCQSTVGQGSRFRIQLP